MALTIEPADATLGATITGVHLAGLSAADWRQVEDAFHAFGVLVFPGQHLSEEAQIAFGRRFGDVEQLVAKRDIVPISNRDAEGERLYDASHQALILRGNEGWHTDSSYMPVSAKASVLSCRVAPATGGETEWADMRAAYDALDEPTRQRVAPLAAFHSLYYSQAKIGHQVEVGTGYGFIDGEPPLRPLVKTHPVTGRPALYMGRHAYGIVGLSAADSERLLSGLVAFACQPPRVWGHRWQPGDVVIWDNRCVMHRARPYDQREPRVMMHTRIAGDPATESALATTQPAPPIDFGSAA